MSTPPNRLFSIQELQEAVDGSRMFLWNEKIAGDCIKQLLDTMRANEELRKHPLKMVCSKCGVEELAYPPAFIEALSSKESDNA